MKTTVVKCIPDVASCKTCSNKDVLLYNFNYQLIYFPCTNVFRIIYIATEKQRVFKVQNRVMLILVHIFGYEYVHKLYEKLINHFV